jgi:hypothetical protein
MRLDYFEDLQATPARVLLMHDFGASDVHLLLEAVRGLGNRVVDGLQIDELPGFWGSCSLEAALGDQDLGIEPAGARGRAFRCVLSPAGWQRALGLLEPFMGGAEGFQHLTEAGSVEWIISTDGKW